MPPKAPRVITVVQPLPASGTTEERFARVFVTVREHAVMNAPLDRKLRKSVARTMLRWRRVIALYDLFAAVAADKTNRDAATARHLQHELEAVVSDSIRKGPRVLDRWLQSNDVQDHFMVPAAAKAVLDAWLSAKGGLATVLGGTTIAELAVSLGTSDVHVQTALANLDYDQVSPADKKKQSASEPLVSDFLDSLGFWVPRHRTRKAQQSQVRTRAALVKRALEAKG